MVLSQFWRAQRPSPLPLPTGEGFRAIEWPFEDETRTVALLEKIKWAMAQAEADPEQTIVVRRDPKTYKDAIYNLHACSDEARRSLKTPDASRDRIPPPPFPSLPTCHGWMRIKRDDLPRLDQPVWAEVDADLDWQWALVYDFVPGAKQDVAVAQTHLDFLPRHGLRHGGVQGGQLARGQAGGYE